MAHVLALLASGRTKGFTASLLEAASRGARSVDGVEVEFVHLHRYRFAPCASCFTCIRGDDHDCGQNDAMGGDGELMAKVKGANGWILSDPVHFWGPSAQTHLFIERCYPFLWSGGLHGMPFASMSCASNQGMQRLADEQICKWAFCHGFRYMGGLPVHTTYLEQGRKDAEALGRRLGEAAVEDARGRKGYTDKERFVMSLKRTWSALEPYLENLTNGTMEFEPSLIAQGLAGFQRPEAVELLRQAEKPFREALALFKAGEHEASCEVLVESSALWTHATWKEFLEQDVTKTEVPEAYRPMEG